MDAIPMSAWRTFGITVLAVFMVSLDSTVVVAVFPMLRHAFASTPEWMLSWILNGYTIAYASLLVPAGRWVDRSGHKRTFLLGLAVFTVASAVCGISGRVEVMIGARILQAVGAALLTPAALALTLEAFPPKQRSVAVGLWSAAGALAAAFGPAFGSWVAEFFSWPMIFSINVPIGIAAGLLGVRLLPRSLESFAKAPPDLFGSVLLMATATSFCVAVVRASHQPAAVTGQTLLVGAGLGIGFFLWGRCNPVGTQDLAVFKARNFALANGATFVFGVAFGMMFLSFFYFMLGVWHFSPSRAGLAATPGPLLVIPTAILAGRMAARIGHRRLLIFGGLLSASANLWYFFRVTERPEYWAGWFPGQVMGGIAIGVLLPSLTSQALAGLPPERFGVGSAANSAIRQFGIAFGVAATVALLGSGDATLASFRVVFLILMGMGITVAAMATALDSGASRQRLSRRLAGKPAQSAAR